MTEINQYEKKEWYLKASEEVIDVFDKYQASNSDILIILAMILKGMSSLAAERGIHNTLIFNTFKKVYDSLTDRKNDEVKKE